jgi:hypothetical protein
MRERCTAPATSNRHYIAVIVMGSHRVVHSFEALKMRSCIHDTNERLRVTDFISTTITRMFDHQQKGNTRITFSKACARARAFQQNEMAEQFARPSSTT